MGRVQINGRNQFLVPDSYFPRPNPNCYVCASDPAITLKVDTKRITMKDLRDEVLIKTLNMLNPDVTVNLTGSILISSEKDETTENEEKLLSKLNVVDGVILACDDFHRNYNLSIIINHFDAKRDDNLFEVVGEKSQLQPKEEEKDKTEKVKTSRKRSTNGEETTYDGPPTSKRSRLKPLKSKNDDDDDDDCLVIEEDDNGISEDVAITTATHKLTVSSSPNKELRGSKRKFSGEISEFLDSSDEEDSISAKQKKSKLDNEVISID